MRHLLVQLGLLVRLRLTTTRKSTHMEWFKSSFSNPTGNCVEVRNNTEQGTIDLRNSRFPGGGELEFTPAEMTAFIRGVKAGELDHLLA